MDRHSDCAHLRQSKQAEREREREREGDGVRNKLETVMLGYEINY